MVHIELHAESDTGLMSDERWKEILQHRAGKGQALQLISANTSVTLLATGVPTPMDLEGEEETMEADAGLDVNVPRPDSEMAKALSSATPTPIPIY